MLGTQRLNRYDNADERINPFNLSKNQCKARRYCDLLRPNKWFNINMHNKYWKMHSCLKNLKDFRLIYGFYYNNNFFR